MANLVRVLAALFLVIAFFVVEGTFFGLNPIEAIIELLIVAFLSAILFLPFLGVLWLAFKRVQNFKAQRTIFIIALCLWGAVEMSWLVNHYVMSSQLRELRMEFKGISTTGDWNWGQGREADYGGKLDAVVEKRNALLKERGYTMLCRWESGLGDPLMDRTVGIFIYVGK